MTRKDGSYIYAPYIYRYIYIYIYKYSLLLSYFPHTRVGKMK